MTSVTMVESTLTVRPGRGALADMRLALIINRSAGGFRRHRLAATVAAIRDILVAGGHEVRLLIVGRHHLTATLVTQADQTDLDAVVVGGGDGTILAAVVAGLGRERPLGILPLGTLNLFARDIGLPLDPIQAARALAGAGVDQIDLAEANGVPFAIWASLGLHPWAVRRRDHYQRRGLRKGLAMAVAALRALIRFPRLTVTLGLPDSPRTVTTPMVFISNNAWREEAPPLSRETLADGRLEIHVADCPDRVSVLALIVEAMLGRWRSSQRLRTFVAPEVRIEGTRSRLMLSLDGEVLVMRSPVVVRVRPKALKVLIPGRETNGT